MQALLLFAALLAPGDSWSYDIVEEDGSTVVKMTGVTVIFAGVPRSGGSSGGLQIAGPGTTSGQVGAGKRAFTDSYANGVNTMTYAGHTLLLKEGATKLVIGKKTFDLSGKMKTIVVKANGEAEEKGAK